jgi:hypothetical protein
MTGNGLVDAYRLIVRAVLDSTPADEQKAALVAAYKRETGNVIVVACPEHDAWRKAVRLERESERRDGSTRIIPYRGAEIRVTLAGVWWNFPGQRKHEAKSANTAMGAINKVLGPKVLKLDQSIESDSTGYVTTHKTRWKLAYMGTTRPTTYKPQPVTKEAAERLNTGKSDDCPF